jgi:nucleoside-diphosphate-sugar epimerase
MEFIARTYSELPIVICRPFNYTGPGHDERFVIPKLVRHFRERLAAIELGDVSIEREFNDVRMVTEAYLRILDVETQGDVLNICTGKTYSLAEVLETLIEITGHKIDVRRSETLLRRSDARHISGSPSKLISAIGDLPSFDLRSTLQSILVKI